MRQAGAVPPLVFGVPCVPGGRGEMGRAITRDPKVFLFDEPLSDFDAKPRVQ